MRTRRLGSGGLQLSEVSLGTYLTFGERLDLAEARRVVHAALDAGIYTFDTADGYAGGEAERMLGRILSGVDRSQWVVSTKAFFPQSDAPTDRGLSRKHLVESVERSLGRLQVDHLDLFQCHRWDPDVPLAETVETLDDLVRQGKILYWGVGRCNAAQLGELTAAVTACGARRPVAHQTLYGAFNRQVEEDVLAATARAGLGALVYGVLGQGVLTGKYRVDASPPEGSRADGQQRGTMYHLERRKLEVAEELRGVAEASGVPLASAMIAWVLQRPEVSTAIVGATRPDQIRANALASGLELPDELRSRIDRLLPGPGGPGGA